jgi:hypothetical protein
MTLGWMNENCRCHHQSRWNKLKKKKNLCKSRHTDAYLRKSYGIELNEMRIDVIWHDMAFYGIYDIL